MKISKLTLLFVLCCWKATLAVECPASHFDFVGKYALGKQDEVNITFTKILEKFQPLSNITYNTSQSTYTIFNAKPSVFYYRDTEQRANVLGNDTIVIYGGRLEAYLTFQWKKQGISTITGSGTAFGLSDGILFVKSIVKSENSSFFSYKLKDYNKVVWGKTDPFRLTRVDPPSITDEDKAAITLILNRIPGVTTVCDQLEAEIQKVYSFYLGNSLHDQHIPIDGQFDYVWRPGSSKPNVTLPFARRGIDVRIDDEGVRLSYEVQAVNDSMWKCGNRSVPAIPQKPEIYGASQEFISYDFYQNVIRSAIAQKLLDSDLTRANWESRMFQFSAGDLYEVLGKVQELYYAFETVDGKCKASYSTLKVAKSGSNTFNVSLNYDCELSILRTKIVDFTVGLQLEVQGVPLATSLDFKLRAHSDNVTLFAYSDFKILNGELGKTMVKHSINRLYEGLLFGSGWPLSPPRDYPHFSTEENFTFIYDSSHVAASHFEENQL